MAFIELLEGPDSAELDRANFGYVPNYSRLFAHRPDVYEARSELNGAIARSMDLRRYVLATLAISRQLRSSYCLGAHGQVLLDRFVVIDQLRALTDADVMDVVLTAAARYVFSKTLDANDVCRITITVSSIQN